MRLNVLVDNDNCWNLNIVRNTIEYFHLKNLKIDKIWIFPKKLSKNTNSNISLWYIKTFGLYVFIKLGLFYVLVIIRNLISGINNFRSLSNKYNVDIQFINSPNDQNLIEEIKKKKIQISIAITDHIFKEKIIDIKNHYLINKHSSLLPSYRGLFPYFWTKVFNKSNGVTFHLIDKKIDNGKILYQKKINKRFISMVSFYMYIFNNYPKDLMLSIINFKKKKFIKKKYSKSYYSLPDRKNYNKFLKNNGCIISIFDLFKTSQILKYKK
tara:strand:- start:566 stop:1369 length:804 start_codon:yes stop_codon:yes gene_type:complete